MIPARLSYRPKSKRFNDNGKKSHHGTAITTREASSSRRCQQHVQHNQRNESRHCNDKNHAFIERYRNFLRRHEPSLDVLEYFMERFVFYGYLFKHDHGHGMIEVYYAAWNFLRWMNDVVLVGWGEGAGLTCGRREEWLVARPDAVSDVVSDAVSEKWQGWQDWPYFQNWLAVQLHWIIPLLRSLLAAASCVYPAMEAWSRRPLLSSNPYGHDPSPAASTAAEHDVAFFTSTDPPPRTRRLRWQTRKSNAARTVHRLERFKFVARLTLLAASWWARQQRRFRDNSQLDDDRERSVTHDEAACFVPALLRRGGELDPYEQMVSLDEAQEEARVLQYVGKRTGRRSVSASSSTDLITPNPFLGKSWFRGKQLLDRWNHYCTPKNQLMLALGLGELLHIFRPFYWSLEQKNEQQRQIMSSSSSSTNKSNSFSPRFWRSWFIALAMDLLSHKLSQHSNNDKHVTSSPKKRRSSLFTTRHAPSAKTRHSAEQAKNEELEWRKSRHGMYLLRSPMYDSVTRPVMLFIGRLVAMIPSFGLGSWAAEYALDMMSYWNDHYFMLES